MTLIRPAAMFVVSLAYLAGLQSPPNEIRLGIIGTDTSHVTAFTKLLNDKNDPAHVPGRSCR